MTTIREEHAVTRRSREQPAIIDCDVHNALKKPEDLKPYLPARWHVYYDQGPRPGVSGGQALGARPQPHVYRGDSVPAEGEPGSDLELMREQLLDAYNVTHAVVHPINNLLRMPTYGAAGGAIVQALNDWMIAEWLERDERIYGSISVTVEDGELAAKEIARVAQHPKFAKVMLPMVTREGLGHPKYWPIYEAATKFGLPVAAHVGGFSGTQSGAGWTTYFLEHHAAYAQHYQTHVVSLVYSGVFEQLPNLQFVLEEGGLTWLAPLMWRLDHSWEAMREVVPHLAEPPSEIIRRHFYFTTQPLDEPDEPKFLPQVLDMLNMDDRIMFSSDYPHWDFDDPTRVLPASLIGAERRKKIMTTNAERLFGFGR
jgi:predicted TIM-barrel fold metal-dependent hydrolase